MSALMCNRLKRYEEALRRISNLDQTTEIRGGTVDWFCPENQIKPGGWVKMHPQFKQGLDYASKIAKDALMEESSSVQES